MARKAGYKAKGIKLVRHPFFSPVLGGDIIKISYVVPDPVCVSVIIDCVLYL